MARHIKSQGARFRGYLRYDYKSKRLGDICCDIVGKLLNNPSAWLCLMGIDEDLDHCIRTTIKHGPPPDMGRQDDARACSD